MSVTLGVGPATAAGAGSDTSLVISLVGTTIGRSIVVGAAWESTATITGITCSGESDLTVVVTEASSWTTAIAWLPDNTAGGDKTITISLSAASWVRSGWAAEFIGLTSADATAVGTGTSISTVSSLTTGVDNALVVGQAIHAGTSATAGAGYTEVTTGTNGTGEYALDGGAAGARNVDFDGSNDFWVTCSASFAPTAPSMAVFNTPVVTLAAVGYVTQAAEFNLPLVSLLAGDDGAQFNLLTPTVASTGGITFVGGSAISLHAISLVAIGETGIAATSAFNLPVLTIDSAGFTGSVGTAEFSLPVVTLSIVARQTGAGTGAFSLPVARLSAAGKTGGLGTASFSLPVLTLAVSAHQSSNGSAAFNLLPVYLSAAGASSLAAAYRTWVLNTQKGALTEYDAFNFNSYATFNGVVLACGPAGVFVLGQQDLDNATAITGRYRTAQSDFDTAWHKRVPRLYIAGSQGGDLYLRSITVEGGTRTYTLLSNNITGQQQRRVPIGRGPRSRFFQFELENKDGCEFSTMSLMAYPKVMRRRIS